MMSGVEDEIRTEHLPSRSIVGCRYSSPSDFINIEVVFTAAP
jgi:hypothetical protein